MIGDGLTDNAKKLGAAVRGFSNKALAAAGVGKRRTNTLTRLELPSPATPLQVWLVLAAPRVLFKEPEMAPKIANIANSRGKLVKTPITVQKARMNPRKSRFDAFHPCFDCE